MFLVLFTYILLVYVYFAYFRVKVGRRNIGNELIIGKQEIETINDVRRYFIAAILQYST